MTPRLLGLLPGARGRLALAALLGVAAAASAVGLLTTSGYLISKAALQPPVLYLMVAIVAVRFFALARALLRYAERLVLHDVSFRLLATLRVWLYRRLEPLLPAGLGDARTGDVLGRMVGDVDALQDVLIRALTPPVVAALLLLVAVAITWSLAPAAVPVLVASFAITGVGLPLLARRRSRPPADEGARLRGRLGAVVVEMLSGARDVAAFGRRQAMLDRLARLDRDIARGQRRLASVLGGLDGAMVGAQGIACAAVLAAAIPSVGHGLDGVWLGALALATLGAFEALQPLPDALQRLERGRAAASRVFAVADRPDPISEPARPRRAFAGAVALDGAWLRYGPDQPWALAGVDLRLEPGRRVALVGPSGAGKTTLAHVLLRFRELDRGRATLAGHDLREYAQDDVRRVVGLCAQDAHVFDTTLYENVRLARPDATREEVADAARRAQLLDWIASLPAGWDTPVGDRGDRLSGGQRQRLALARALLADFPILILDEPTANLDGRTAATLMRDVLAATEGRTVLLITHRPEGLDAMDEVLTMRDGRIEDAVR